MTKLAQLVNLTSNCITQGEMNLTPPQEKVVLPIKFSFLRKK